MDSGKLFKFLFIPSEARMINPGPGFFISKEVHLMKQERKDLLTLLTSTYILKDKNEMPSHVFISSRGRIRQLCHKHGIKFLELDREAKTKAAKAI